MHDSEFKLSRFNPPAGGRGMMTTILIMIKRSRGGAPSCPAARESVDIAFLFNLNTKECLAYYRPDPVRTNPVAIKLPDGCLQLQRSKGTFVRKFTRLCAMSVLRILIQKGGTIIPRPSGPLFETDGNGTDRDRRNSWKSPRVYPNVLPNLANQTTYHCIA